MNLAQRKSPRRKGYDYGSAGAYFVTICAAGRQHYFGEICRDGISGRPIMELSDVGKIIDYHINQFTNYWSSVDLDEYIIMPNHIHLLLIIGENNHPITQEDSSMIKNKNIGRAEIASLQSQPLGQEFGSLGYIINLFKGGCTREINKKKDEGIIDISFNDRFSRQSRYHDHIIRNKESYHKIKYYIQTNPQNRESDTFNQ